VRATVAWRTASLGSFDRLDGLRIGWASSHPALRRGGDPESAHPVADGAQLAQLAVVPVAVHGDSNRDRIVSAAVGGRTGHNGRLTN
jgi:hypothetical protein